MCCNRCGSDKIKSILFILPGTRVGGAEQILRMLAAFYANNGFKVTILILKVESISGWESVRNLENIELVYLNSRNSYISSLFFLIMDLLKRRKNQFEYVFTSHVHMNALVGICRKFKLIKTVNAIGRESTSIFLHFKGVKLILIKLLYHLGYHNIDLLICQTELMRDQLLTNLPFLRKKVKVAVIPNPIDSDSIREKSKEVVNVLDQEPFIVAAGRLVHVKGFDILIKTFAELLKKRPELNLIILGEGPDRSKLTALIEEIGVVGKVHLIGHVENVLPYFKKAEACVVSSRLEGFPNVLLQMMSQNAHVVCTLCCGGISAIPYIQTAKTEDINSLLGAIVLSLESVDKDVRATFDQLLKERELGSFVEEINRQLNV